MSSREGGESFGFAPRGDPVRRHADRRADAPQIRAPSEAPRVPRSPIAYVDDRTHVTKLPWAWLLIGFLLGTGGTLLTSSLWLPERESHDLAGAAAGDLESTANGEGMTAVADLTEAEREPDDAIDSLPEIAAIDNEGVETRPPADSESELIAEQTEPAGTPELLPDIDIALPSDEDAVSDDAKTQAAARDSEPKSAKPEEALQRSEDFPEVLASTGEPSLEDDRADAPADIVADNVDRRQPAPEPPAATVEADPPDEVDPADLPPRIRQALRKANAEPQPRVATDGGNRGRVYRVQLAAVNDEAAARIYWRQVNERLPGVFVDVEPVFDQRVVDERQYLRIWVGAFDSHVDALGYCGWLKQQGQDCFVTRADNL